MCEIIHEVSVFAKTVFEDSIKSLFKKDYILADHVVSKAKTILHLENEVIKEINLESSKQVFST